MKFIKKPLFIRFDVTSKCNFDCTACYRPTKKIKDLLTDKIFKIIDKIVNFGVKRIIFGGGEPFLRKNFEEIVMYANKKGLNCDIVSNGTLIKKNHIKFLKKYVSELSISLDGHNEKINGKIRPKFSFKKIIKTLCLLKRNKLNFNLITTLSKVNFNYIEEIIAFGKKIGAKEHHFIRFIPIGRGSKYKNWYLSDKEWYQVIERLKVDERLLFDEQSIAGDCGVGKEFLCILANGDITPCTRKYSKKWRLGNILKDNIKEVFHTSFMLDKLKKTKRNNCLSCNV